MEFVNTSILKNPINWITILLMLVIFSMFAGLVLDHYSEIHARVNPNPVANQ